MLDDFQGPDGCQISPGEVCWDGFQRLMNKTVQDVVIFAKRIPGFPNLEQDDQISLIKGGCFEVYNSDFSMSHTKSC